MVFIDTDEQTAAAVLEAARPFALPYPIYKGRESGKNVVLYGFTRFSQTTRTCTHSLTGARQ